MASRGRSIQVSAETIEQAIGALDTANGVCQIIKADRKPIDLEECHAEIMAAYDLLCSLVDERDIGEG